ncbi:MAG: serpin family protein [Kofleriaceae bacterium]
MGAISDADANALAASSNAFAFELHARLQADRGNSAVSPASISAALAMTLGGARGETADELRRALHLEGDETSVFRAWGSLAAGLQDPARKLTLRLANRLFGEQTAAFDPAFLDATKSAFGASLEPVNFVTAPEQARARINQWVAARTRNRITNFLQAGAVDSGTRLTLVNAIYFLAKWRSPFERHDTRPRPFALTATTKKLVQTMHQTAAFRTATADGMAMLELPYQDGEATMLIVLPDAIEGIADIESKLDADRFNSWRAKLTPGDVEVALPKFTIRPALATVLKRVLMQLGVNRMFDPALADFTGLTTKTALSISELFHKAYVAVDEEGTEAAAATGYEGVGAAPPPPEIVVFKADHPFLYFIVDRKTGLILFMGRVADPS